MGYSPGGQKELDTTEQLMLSLFHGRKYSISQKNYEIAKFPGGSEVKVSACNVGDLGSIPGFGRSPGERHGYTLQYSCLENPRDRGYSPWGHKEVDTAEQKTLPLPLPRLDFEIQRQRSF